MTIIHEGLVGIGTHNPQRRLHISESGNRLTDSKTPLRVENFGVGSGKQLVWDEKTGDVFYQNKVTDAGGTTNAGDSGIGVLAVGSTFIIGPFNTFTKKN